MVKNHYGHDDVQTRQDVLNEKQVETPREQHSLAKINRNFGRALWKLAGQS